MLNHKSSLVVLLLTLLLIVAGCNGTGTQTGSPTSSSIAGSPPGSAKKTDEQEENSNTEDTADPDYYSVLSKVKTEAQKYWDDRFMRCGATQSGADRWFSVNMANNKPEYLEVVKLRKFTTFPFRSSNADKFNKEWRAVSAVHGEAWRSCSESPCGKYTGGTAILSDFIIPMKILFHEDSTFQSGLLTLSIRVEKGRYSSDDPATNYYLPKSCEEIRKHPIWKEY